MRQIISKIPDGFGIVFPKEAIESIVGGRKILGITYRGTLQIWVMGSEYSEFRSFGGLGQSCRRRFDEPGRLWSSRDNSATQNQRLALGDAIATVLKYGDGGGGDRKLYIFDDAQDMAAEILSNGWNKK